MDLWRNLNSESCAYFALSFSQSFTTSHLCDCKNFIISFMRFFVNAQRQLFFFSLQGTWAELIIVSSISTQVEIKIVKRPIRRNKFPSVMFIAFLSYCLKNNRGIEWEIAALHNIVLKIDAFRVSAKNKKHE